MAGISLWLFRHFIRDDGQTLLEYALIIALIAAVLVLSLVIFANQISSAFSTVAGSF
jgi:Flp pilus assembly pilin Flp